MKNIVIGICTCNRNTLLEKALKSLALSILNLSDRYTVSVIVVDNNNVPTAKKIVDDVKNINIYYDFEERKGIPYARNKVIYFAREKNADFLAFIDDDEEVRLDWLSNITVAIDQPGVDVVSGLVSQHGTLKSMGHDKERDRAETDNVIMKNWIFESYLFDEDLAQTGGTDTLFFRQAHKAGAIIKYCRNAIVDEFMPISRLSLNWRIARHYRYGLVNIAIEKKLGIGFFKKIILLLKSFFNVFFGFIMIPFGFIVGGKNGAERYLLRTARGAGGIAAFIGHNYLEYKR